MPESQTPPEMSRRDCLNWLARATVGIAAADLCGLRAHCAEKGEKKDGWVKLANLAALRNESATEFAKQNVILTRSSAGVAALGVFCTHRHNRLEVEDGSIVCPVHDSIFDLSGKPQSGPASRALASYLTQIDDDGAIRVDTSKTVKTGTFAELPAWAKSKK